MSEEIEVRISEGDKETLINHYVMEHLHDESWEVFTDSCHKYQFEDGKHYGRALVDAVVNEMVINILEEEIEKQENKFLLFGA